MTYDVDMTTTARPPLTRERIIEAAVTYADEHGVEDLSMRKLGSALGVEAMSLYNHVENKDDILDGMIDHVFSLVPLPDPGLDWKAQTRQIGKAAMDAFTQHPWVVFLLMHRGALGPGALRFMNHVLGELERAGFSPEDQHHAWQMLSSHTMGYAVQQATNPGRAEGEFADAEYQLARLGDQLPHVARLAPLLTQCHWSAEYMFGLEIIIDGLEARLRR